MLIKNSINIRIKQQQLESVNNIDIRTDHLTYNQRQKLESICQKYQNIFSDPDEKLTFITSVKAEIRTTTDSPVYSLPLSYGNERCYRRAYPKTP